MANLEGAWQLTGDLPDVERDLPPSVCGMIQRKIEQLEVEEALQTPESTGELV